jgi:hypothetical protein
VQAAWDDEEHTADTLDDTGDGQGQLNLFYPYSCCIHSKKQARQAASVVQTGLPVTMLLAIAVPLAVLLTAPLRTAHLPVPPPAIYLLETYHQATRLLTLASTGLMRDPTPPTPLDTRSGQGTWACLMLKMSLRTSKTSGIPWN